MFSLCWDLCETCGFFFILLPYLSQVNRKPQEEEKQETKQIQENALVVYKESFFTKINLHIIQCDADIQEAVKITNQHEFDEYMKNMKIHGLGGTDFRPVFEYVGQLRNNKEFSNLKGLIYFTDGYGAYPERKPDYDTAFVFVDDEYNNPDVPPWAIKLVLQRDEI